MSYQLYEGPLDLKKMSKKVQKAYWIWAAQNVPGRSKNNYSSREFIGWWLHNLKKKKWKDPTCGRIDHAQGYFFGNIVMQERGDNTKERNARLGNPCRTHHPVLAVVESGEKVRFVSQATASAALNISVRTIYNHCTGRTKNPGKYGPKINKNGVVRFEWA